MQHKNLNYRIQVKFKIIFFELAASLNLLVGREQTIVPQIRLAFLLLFTSLMNDTVTIVDK